MTTPSSRVVLEINLGAIRRNFRALQRFTKPTRLMGVLKANAYGLGVSSVAATLAQEGIDFFGVAEPKEAFEIDDLGIPILILGSVLPSEIPEAVDRGIRLPITSVESAKQISLAALSQKKTATCHVLVDTGMGRLGIPTSNAISDIKEIIQLSGIELEGIYSHFPSAYSDKKFSEQQIQRLLDTIEKLKTHHIFKEIHISNSDGIHNISDALKSPFTLARTGINLYGCFDLEGRKALKLEEAVSIRSKIVSIRNLEAGASIGYGRQCILKKPTRVGTVGIGYADGLPLSFSQNGYLIVKGSKCPILGRTSMDYTTIDLSHCPRIQVEDEVICLGNGITVSDWARAKGTIPYEVICSIGNRVERKVVEQ